MASDEITIKIPGVPPSLNSSHRFYPGGSKGRIRKYPVPSLSRWMELVDMTVKEREIRKAPLYGMTITFHLPMFYKNGLIKKIDVSNLIKYAEDAVCKKVVIGDQQLDDCLITELSACKVDSPTEWTQVLIYGIDV